MKKWILAALILAALALFLILKNNFLPVTPTFNGSAIRNPDGYYLDFTLMNKEDSCTMPLNAGDTLHCSWDITKGKVNILITSEAGETIYQGDEIDQAEFDLGIPSDGKYTISISAKKAKGKITIEAVK